MSQLHKLKALLTKAKTSSWSRYLLNKILLFAIPFNKPHNFTIHKIEDNKVIAKAPYKRKNRNHIRGVHACAIATVGELCAGTLLISKLDPSEYRILISSLTVEYHYQAKTEIFSETCLTPEEIASDIVELLKQQDVIFKDLKSLVRDTSDNLVATVTTRWQVKSWKKVKTQV